MDAALFIASVASEETIKLPQNLEKQLKTDLNQYNYLRYHQDIFPSCWLKASFKPSKYV